MSDTKTPGDVRVSGAGTIATGTYRTVSVSGSAVLTGDIECVDFKVSGAAQGDGALRAESVTVHGTLSYRGDAEVAAHLRVSGTASFDALKASDANVSGTLAVTSVSATTVKVQGLLNVSGDCEAERFTCQGAFSVDGLLNAGVVDITLGGKCVAREIGGEAVTVRTGVGALKLFVTSLIPAWELRLTAESIEGDDVRLEYTTARAVRGNTVVIGPGCEIELVEYTGEYSAASDAIVKTVRKVNEGTPEGGDAGA